MGDINKSNVGGLDLGRLAEGLLTPDTLRVIQEAGKSLLNHVDNSSASGCEQADTSVGLPSPNSFAPDERDIIQQFYAAWERPMYAHAASVVGNRYQHLSDYIAQRVTAPPLEQLTESIDHQKGIERGIGYAQKFVNVGTGFLSGKLNVQKESNFVQEVLNLFRSLKEAEAQRNVSIKAMYDKMAAGIKGYAAMEKIEPTAVVAKQEYMDEVFRFVFPTREAAEGFYESIETSEGNRLNAVRQLTTKIEGNIVPKLLADMIPNRSSPSEKGYLAFVEACRSYRVAHFDRIYTPN